MHLSVEYPIQSQSDRSQDPTRSEGQCARRVPRSLIPSRHSWRCGQGTSVPHVSVQTRASLLDGDLEETARLGGLRFFTFAPSVHRHGGMLLPDMRAPGRDVIVGYSGRQTAIRSRV